eukprot:scaffold13660_cov54-Cylindrotheca_fusiformis.AAC.1
MSRRLGLGTFLDLSSRCVKQMARMWKLHVVKVRGLAIEDTVHNLELSTWSSSTRNQQITEQLKPRVTF